MSGGARRILRASPSVRGDHRLFPVLRLGASVDSVEILLTLGLVLIASGVAMLLVLPVRGLRAAT